MLVMRSVLLGLRKLLWFSGCSPLRVLAGVLGQILGMRNYYYLEVKTTGREFCALGIDSNFTSGYLELKLQPTSIFQVYCRIFHSCRVSGSSIDSPVASAFFISPWSCSCFSALNEACLQGWSGREIGRARD